MTTDHCGNCTDPEIEMKVNKNNLLENNSNGCAVCALQDTSQFRIIMCHMLFVVLRTNLIVT